MVIRLLFRAGPERLPFDELEQLSAEQGSRRTLSGLAEFDLVKIVLLAPDALHHSQVAAPEPQRRNIVCQANQRVDMCR